MTREEAIKRFENQLKAAIVVLDSGFGTRPGENDRIYRERKEMAQLAIAALREQEKHRWIPVTERLPDLIPCSAGTEYSEAVNVLTSGRKVLTAIWDGTDFIADAEFWEAEGEEITHWTPVLLPLPDPPKGGQT